MRAGEGGTRGKGSAWTVIKDGEKYHVHSFVCVVAICKLGAA